MTKLEVAANEYACKNYNLLEETLAAMKSFKKGAEWREENLWHDAQGDDLPKIDREVIVLCDDGHGGYKVAFAHRPYKKGYLGKSLITGNIETYYPETHGKGEWSIPDVRWWLDVSIPKEK